MTDRFWTIPNILSLYRIAAAPVIAVCIVVGRPNWYIALLTVSLLTDIADGLIARRFNMGTKFGARLDSVADLLTYILAFWGACRFKWAIVSQPPHAIAFFIFLTFYLLMILTGCIKFGRQPSLHTYSFKLTAYLQGACVVSIFLWGFHAGFYYLALGWGVLACIEEILILLILPEPRSDVKGLYWVLRERRRLS